MSLLLDALYKASKDKEKAAELSLAPQTDLPVAEAVPSLAEPLAAPELASGLAMELELPNMPLAKAEPDYGLELAPLTVQTPSKEVEPISQPQVREASPFPPLELTLEPRHEPALVVTPSLQPEEPILQPMEQPVEQPSSPPAMQWTPQVSQKAELTSAAGAMNMEAAPSQEAVPVAVAEPRTMLQATSEPVSEPVAQPASPTQSKLETETSTTQPDSEPKASTIKQPSKIAQLLSRGSVQSTSSKKANPAQKRVLVLGGTAMILMVLMAGLFLWQPTPMPHNPVPAAVENVEAAAVAEEAQAIPESQATDTLVADNVKAVTGDPVTPNLPAVAQPELPVSNVQAAPVQATVPETPLKAPVFRSGNNSQPVISARIPPNPLEHAYTALQEGRLEAAQQSYTTVLRSNPFEVNALLGMAYIAHQQGQREQALDFYQRVLRQDPSNAAAMAAVLELDARIDSTTARLKAQDLAERQPDSVAAISQAAHALVAQGRVAEAIPWFARAQWLEPNNPLHAYNHAVALDRMGQVQQALAQYQHVLQLAEKTTVAQARPFSVDAIRQRVAELKSSVTAQSEARP
jgi:tetratricopeptide (TPR) repeat protein